MEKVSESSESMTTKEVMEHLGVGVNYVFMLLKGGRLKGVKKGKKWFIFKDSVEKYGEERRIRALRILGLMRNGEGNR